MAQTLETLCFTGLQARARLCLRHALQSRYRGNISNSIFAIFVCVHVDELLTAAVVIFADVFVDSQSGLEYAVLAGGDVAPLGKDAITELHKVFDWSENSRKGTLLFIDEADAFLRKRGTGGDGMMSEEQRNALSTFLYRTGTPSNKTMIVIATNEPTTVDSAILDRMDEAVEFGLPEATERERLFEQYFDELIVNPKNGAQKIRLADDIQVCAESVFLYPSVKIISIPQ